jgi:hypothetical protein
MNPQAVSRSLTQIVYVIQNVLANLPESQRHQLTQAICSSIKEGTSAKGEIERILDDSNDPFAQAKLPPA